MRYSEKSLNRTIFFMQFIESSNVHQRDRGSNTTPSNLAYKNKKMYYNIARSRPFFRKAARSMGTADFGHFEAVTSSTSESFF